jgi:hypothetical protein
MLLTEARMSSERCAKPDHCGDLVDSCVTRRVQRDELPPSCAGRLVVLLPLVNSH